MILSKKILRTKQTWDINLKIKGSPKPLYNCSLFEKGTYYDHLSRVKRNKNGHWSVSLTTQVDLVLFGCWSKRFKKQKDLGNFYVVENKDKIFELNHKMWR